MKQFAFLVLLTLIGTFGCLVRPFYGLLVYYLFAVLRPNFLWEWALPVNVQWMRYVGVAVTAYALLVFAGLAPVRQGKAVKWSPRRMPDLTHRLFLINFLWVCVSYAVAHDQAFSARYFSDIAKIYLILFATYMLLGDVIELWSLLVATVLGLVYIGMEVNQIYLSSGWLWIYNRGFAGLDNNGAGLMLAMGIPVCVAVWDTLRTGWRWFFMAAVPLMLHAVLLTYSRGAMVSLLGATPLMLLRSRHRSQMAGLLLAFGLFVIPVMAGPQIRQRFFTITQHEVDESANSRKQSWKAAWLIALDHPFLGVGLRNANLFSHRYGADMEGRTIHNQYLQVAADSGFIGLGLYLAMLGAVWFDCRSVRRWARTLDTIEARRMYGIAYAVETSMNVFCIGAIFLSLETFELPFLMMALIAQAAALVRIERQGERKQSHGWSYRVA
jgi:probable O-glycosylation ligase (exosortase A-associated)